MVGVDGFRQGNRDALAREFRAKIPVVEPLLFRLVDTEREVIGLLEDTLSDAVRTFHQFRADTSVGTWLRQIAVRQAIYHLTHPGRRRYVLMGSAPRASSALLTKEQSEEKHRVARLRHLLARLSARERVALVLHVFAGCSLEETTTLMSSIRPMTSWRLLLARHEILKLAEQDLVLQTVVAGRSTEANLQALKRLSDQMVQELSPGTRNQVITRALAWGIAPSSNERGPWTALAVGAAAVAFVGMGLYALLTRPISPPRVEPIEPAPVFSVEPDRAIEAEIPMKVALDHAAVLLRENSSIEWNRAERTVDIERGELIVEVDPAADRTFRVRTSGFVVEARGATFRVDHTGVDVYAGTVDVVDQAGSRLATVGPDESWPVERPASRPASRPTPTRTETAGRPMEPITVRPRLNRMDHLEMLRESRRALSQKRIKQAKSSILRVLQSTTTPRPYRAEATMLIADCAVAEGRNEEARGWYLDVVKRYPELPAAETALFAAAQNSNGQDSVDLLNRYLAAHPNGRFTKQARWRLERSGRTISAISR